MKIFKAPYFSLILIFLNLSGWNSFAQIFVKVTDQTNPVVTTVTDGGYTGAAWVDFDNDGNLDLFTTKNFLFRNLGNGNFQRVTDFQSLSSSQLGNGTSWADYDNDGDIDLFLSGNPSLVYNNDGSGNFEAANEAPLGTSDDNRGWTGAWADYNNDGFVDLVIIHPDGFIGNPGIPSRFFINNGDGRFTKITSFEFTLRRAAYTVGTWSDYDQDGDMDLFIGSGPVSHAAIDYLYDNTLVNTGLEGFDRITTDPIATDLQDGQVWNWIDYDNDGDLDAMLTNYGSAPNRLYKNNDGVYESLTNNLTAGGSYLGNSWGDIDNDGDLDVILTHEGGVRVFLNDGNDSFTNETNFSGAARSSTLGDYNNDGDLDMFISAPNTVRGLYENTISNGNNWVIFSLTGTVSNKSAIGTKVKLKATINGNPVWQYRELLAQNNFNGQNSLRVHYGLGDATIIDSVIIHYPSGQQKALINLAVNNFYSDEEEYPSGFLRANFKTDSIKGEGQLTVQFTDLSVANPNFPVSSYEWDFNNDGVIDATDQNPMFTYSSANTYSVRLVVSNGTSSDSLTRGDYITVNPVSDVENNPFQFPDQFSLEQNYPNPFNPATKIRYSIPEESDVILKVYNSLGQEITTLVNEKKPQGFYEINFGSEILPSGIYIYRLTAGDFTSVKKMLIIK